MGCGSGYVITSLALLLRQAGISASLLATDLNPAALAATARTLEAHEVRSHRLLPGPDLKTWGPTERTHSGALWVWGAGGGGTQAAGRGVLAAARQRAAWPVPAGPGCGAGADGSG